MAPRQHASTSVNGLALPNKSYDPVTLVANLPLYRNVASTPIGLFMVTMLLMSTVTASAAPSQPCPSSPLAPTPQQPNDSGILQSTNSTTVASSVAKLPQVIDTCPKPTFQNIVQHEAANVELIDNERARLHRLAAEGQVKKIQNSGIEPHEIPLAPEAWAPGLETVLSCFAKDGMRSLEATEITDIAQPLSIAQVNCDVKVGLKNGHFLTVHGAELRQVREHLSQRMKGVELKADNTLHIFPGPGHSFWKLTCGNCDNGLSYHRHPDSVYPRNSVGSTAKEILDSADRSAFLKTIATAKLLTDSTHAFFQDTPVLSSLTDLSRKAVNRAFSFPTLRSFELKWDLSWWRSEQDRAGQRITLELTDQQASDVMRLIKDMHNKCAEDNPQECPYLIGEHNCYDVTQEVLGASGFQGKIVELLDDNAFAQGIPSLSLTDYVLPWRIFSEIYSAKVLFYADSDRALRILSQKNPVLGWALDKLGVVNSPQQRASSTPSPNQLTSDSIAIQTNRRAALQQVEHSKNCTQTPRRDLSVSFGALLGTPATR